MKYARRGFTFGMMPFEPILKYIYDFIATKSWMTYNSKLKKYCVEYIINNTNNYVNE